MHSGATLFVVRCAKLSPGRIYPEPTHHIRGIMSVNSSLDRECQCGSVVAGRSVQDLGHFQTYSLFVLVRISGWVGKLVVFLLARFMMFTLLIGHMCLGREGK